MNKFPEQLKTLRTQKGLSQEDLATQLHLSRQAISRWENGETAPDLDTLIKLASIFDVSLDELVLGVKPVTSYEKSEEDEENLQLLRGREFVLNPETGQYEKRDGMTILIDLISTYWWLIFFVPLIVMWIKLFIKLF
ncbi:helix-turn-helix domain-containing protein [Streptococcus entericus]|uniref:helix-turn-helix domain-containing protein n=1 Tax=Streptococcus entericus TaxID=155680 RepID=UPI00037FC8D3|nr:helix-turn-helix domain-containing protein [Streptococcus entericus]